MRMFLPIGRWSRKVPQKLESEKYQLWILYGALFPS